ncbi:MAG TPA: hypothetical protein VFB21_19620, partial [Chthonomonadaceae bacterium]|nr:hypothetical protein [Chthonomonadaceae bacterium]
REQAALGLRTGTTARGMLSDGVQNIYGYEADNSIILRKEVARRATQNGVKGEAATNQSLRAKDLNQYDKVVSRYQTAQGGVSSVNGGVGGPPGMAVDTPVIGQLFKPAPGNFGGMDGFGGGGFGGRETQGGPQGEAADITVQAVGDRTFYRQKNNVWQDQSYLPKKQKLVQIQAFSDAHFALLKAAPQLAAYSSVGEEVIIRLGRNAVRIGKTGKERLSAAELKELTAR